MTMARRQAVQLVVVVALLLAGASHSSPSNGGQWCPSKTPTHNRSSFGSCAAGLVLNASGGFFPLSKAARHPVMFVPSMIGSNIYRKLHNSREPYPICPNGGYFGGGGDW